MTIHKKQYIEALPILYMDLIHNVKKWQTAIDVGFLVKQRLLVCWCM